MVNHIDSIYNNVSNNNDQNNNIIGPTYKLLIGFQYQVTKNSQKYK